MSDLRSTAADVDPRSRLTFEDLHRSTAIVDSIQRHYGLTGSSVADAYSTRRSIATGLRPVAIRWSIPADSIGTQPESLWATNQALIQFGKSVLVRMDRRL